MGNISVIQSIIQSIDWATFLFVFEHILGACLLFLLFLVLVEFLKHVGYWNSSEELNRYLQDWKDIGITI